MIGKSSRLLIACLASTGLVIDTAHAEDRTADQQVAQSALQRVDTKSPDRWQDWDITIGGGAFYEPISPGVDEYEVTPVPFVDITYRDRFFLNTQRGLGAYVLKSPEVDGRLVEDYGFGVALGYEGGRDADDFEDDDNRRHLGDVDPSPEIKAFAEAEIGFVEAELEFGHGLNSDGHDGWYLELGFAVDHRVTEKFSVSAGPVIRFSDDSHQQAYYGVTAAQARATGLAEYDPGTGLESVSFGVQARYMVTENIGVLALVDYRHLTSDAKDSPIVDDDGQVMGGLALTYTF